MTGRTARTIRLGARFSQVRLGRRVSVAASRRPDGTYEARGVRAAGRASRARFNAVVVKHDRARRRLILSAGGSVFAVGQRAGGRALASASARRLAPGDRVVVSIGLSGLRAWSNGVRQTGRSKLVELEGIFLKKTGDGFDVAVVERGAVHVEVLEGPRPAGLRARRPGQHGRPDRQGRHVHVHSRKDEGEKNPERRR